MCLISNEKEPRIAKENIVVYKAMDCSIFRIFAFSYYRLSLWILGISRSAKMNPKDYYWNRYTTKYIIDEGLHAFTNLDEAWRFCGGIIYKAIIKKGAKYFLSDDGSEIVSNKMKIVKRIKK